jgi:hypothetical protein
MVKEIELTQGYKALVDDEDYPKLSKYKWHVLKSHGNLYARTNVGKGLHRLLPLMHTLILNTPKGKVCDHIDGNGLNNTRNNLRICSTIENHWHQCHKKKESVSNYIGVYWYPRSSKWVTSIGVNGIRYFIGYYDREELAAHAYNIAAKYYFGAFAPINNISEIIDTSSINVVLPLTIKDTTSRYVGVSYKSKNHKWQAALHYSGADHYIGLFDSEIDAALARDEYIITHRLNKPLNLVSADE